MTVRDRDTVLIPADELAAFTEVLRSIETEANGLGFLDSCKIVFELHDVSVTAEYARPMGWQLRFDHDAEDDDGKPSAD